ncbi:fructosamine kinase family protein [Streptomyces niveus]|uniref:fructosamine kinase family protein n=1 Tax=Streptomyces niveus TaxID=193462 RepID=UPI003867982D|nr:fructosamine kinase family protein [Streptomyces niveus]
METPFGPPDPPFVPAPHLLPGAAVGAVPLKGGSVNEVWLVTLADGRSVVVKTTEGLPAALYRREAEGLDALRASGTVLTPRVLELGPDGMVLEAFDPAPADAEFWERAGHAVAALHGTVGDRFGWAADGWLGRLPQRNPWTTDGHAFFAEHRLLRYLEEPLVRRVLADGERADLERICRRLPDLLPAAPPVLTHGDLWRGNVVARPDGAPVFIDPAVCWMWAEADLSMMFRTGGVPARFFDAYQESRPLDAGWQDRTRLLHLRELLSSTAHVGDGYKRVGELRATLRAYR